MSRHLQIRLLLALTAFVVLVPSLSALTPTPTTTPYTCLCADGTYSNNCGHQGACSYHGGYAPTATPTPYYYLPTSTPSLNSPTPIRTWTPTPIRTSTRTPTRTPTPWWLASPTPLPSPTPTPFRTPTATAVPPSFRPTPTPTAPAGCPDERESVKDATDPDVGLINATSVRSTVAQMGSWPKPSILPPRNRISPYETTIWTVSATLVQYKLEADSDYHFVLLDEAGNTMIAEIPSPDCLPDTAPLLSRIRNARNQFDSRYQPERVFATANIPVQVTGIGMFDFIHGQTGVALNGIELHPVLDIQFDQPTSGPDFAISASEEMVGPDQGGHADFSVLVDARSGFESTVALSIFGLPFGATANLLGSVNSGVVTPIDVAVDSSVPPGSYSFIVTGAVAEARRSVVLNLVVSDQRMPVVHPERTPHERRVIIRH